MVPLVINSSYKSVETSAHEVPEGPPLPIYQETTSQINNTTKLSWFHIYLELYTKNVP